MLARLAAWLESRARRRTLALLDRSGAWAASRCWTDDCRSEAFQPWSGGCFAHRFNQTWAHLARFSEALGKAADEMRPPPTPMPGPGRTVGS